MHLRNTKGKPYCRGRVRSADIFSGAGACDQPDGYGEGTDQGGAVAEPERKKLGMYGYAAEKALGESPVGKLEGPVCAAYAASQLPGEARTEVSLTGSSYRDHIVELRAAGVYRFPVSFLD